MPEVEIDYEPRPLQESVHEAMDAHRFGVLVSHRRFGKTILAVNQLIKGALTATERSPRFAYIAPTYSQGKAIAWDYFRYYSAPIPGVQVNQATVMGDWFVWQELVLDDDGQADLDASGYYFLPLGR